MSNGRITFSLFLIRSVASAMREDMRLSRRAISNGTINGLMFSFLYFIIPVSVKNVRKVNCQLINRIGLLGVVITIPRLTINMYRTSQ